VETVLGGERREAAAHPGTLPTAAPGTADQKIPTADTVVEEKLPLPAIVKPTPRKRSGPPDTFREKLAELASGFTLAPLVTVACTAPCAFIQASTPWLVLARVFLLSTLLTWGLLLIGRFPRNDNKNPWSRRAVQFVVGLGIGALAFWLDGWAVPTGSASATTGDLILASGHRFSPETLNTCLCYLFYFGLTTAACRWWIGTDRKRKVRVRVLPVLGAAFWGSVLVFLWPWNSTPAMLGVAPLVIAAIAVQAASPWAGPPLPVAYPVRARSRAAYT
jgi:hypothetical protein